MEQKAMYCGIDVGLKSHTVCLIDKEQQVIKKYAISNDKQGFQKLEYDLNRETKICLEPTGVYSINLFIYIKKKGFNIKFCGTKSASDFRKSMFDKKKHDRLDCVALAKYRIVNENKTFDGLKSLEKLSLENNYATDSDYIVLSDLLNQYMRKTKIISDIKNEMKTIIDLRFPESIQIFPHDRGCKTILKALLHSKEDILKGKVELLKCGEIQDKLRDSIGQFDLKVSDFKYYVKELGRLESEIKEIKKSMKVWLCAKGYASLFNYCGLDTVNIATLISEIRDIKKFFKYNQSGQLRKKKSIKAFKEFMGLAVTSNQSGNHEGAHKLAKAGNIKLRNVLFMMARTYISMNPESASNSDLDPYKFKQIYEKFLTMGKKKLVALTKVMSKIATDLFFIFKDISEMQNAHLLLNPYNQTLTS